MRALLTTTTLFALTCAPCLRAAEDPTPEHKQLMKDADDLMGKIRKGDDVNASAKRLVAAAQDIQKYWSPRSDAGRTTSADLLKAASALTIAAGEAVAENARLAGGSCRGCHTAHRERAADGTYKIK